MNGRVGGSTQIPSLTGYEPKVIEPKDTGIVGQIRMKHRKELWEITTKILSPKIRVNLGKLVLRCPTSSHRCIPIMTQRKTLQTRILKMENYEICWLHT